MSDYPPPPGSPPPGPPPGSPPPPPPPPPGGGWGYPGDPGGPGGAGGYPPGAGGPGYGGYPTGPEGYRVGDAFGYAFRKFKEDFLLLVLITLAIIVGVGIIQGVGNAIVQGMTDSMTPSIFSPAYFVSVLFSALSMVVNLVVQAGIIKAALMLTRGEQVDLSRAFAQINWVQVLVASLLVSVLIFLGLLLCFVGAIPVALFTAFTLWFVIDRDQDAVTALRSSFNLVKDNAGPVVLFFLAAIGIIVLGACLCGVGLLVAIPVVVLAQAYTFRTLTSDPVTA